MKDIGALHPGTITIQDQINPSRQLLAYDFVSQFYSLSQYAESLKDGCLLKVGPAPAVKSWNESFYSDPDPSPDSGGAPYFSPYPPSGFATYRNIRKRLLSSGSVYCTQTDTPVYDSQDMLIANSAYVRQHNGSTEILKKASEMIDVEVFVMLYQRVYTTNNQTLRQKFTISKAPQTIGSLYSPDGSQALYLRLSPDALKNTIDSMQPQLDPSDYAAGDEYDISMYSNVHVVFSLSIKNMP